MELETNDMKVLGAIKRGASGLGSIKSIVHLKSDELEKILDVLDQSNMITVSYGTALLGQRKLIVHVTESATKEMDEYADGLSKRWKEMIDLAIAGERETLDKIIRDEPLLVNMMVFYGVVDMATLSRLNLRFLLEGSHLCYKCKKELGKFAQKFSVSSVRKFNFKLPRGMTTRDDLCADCFDKLTS
uniref:Uncharacterized protein n=1 Tax=uncultured marine crenarchaeote HF4000_APKG8D22 TaxID=455603 RepID=B3TAB0_9ARCH|nr:hypothetical protein ALOHA_HF4000APKG8D22ctg10g3 [uncultured marine crenarchaeote HF4000_APKG8D22]